MKCLAICLVTLAAGLGQLPTGWAGSEPPQPTAVERLVRQERAHRVDVTQIPGLRPPAPPALQVVVADGFDWLDALVGATTALSVTVVVGGAATLVSRSRAAGA